MLTPPLPGGVCHGTWQASPTVNLTEIYVLEKVSELLTASKVASEGALRTAVARGGEVVVKAGVTIELKKELKITVDCAIVGEAGGAAPPTLRRSGEGSVIESKHGCVLSVEGIQLAGAVRAHGGQLDIRGCSITVRSESCIEVWNGCVARVEGGAVEGGLDGLVARGANTRLHAVGVTIQGCRYGIYASGSLGVFSCPAPYDPCTWATVTVQGCTLQNNEEDYFQDFSGAIIGKIGKPKPAERLKSCIHSNGAECSFEELRLQHWSERCVSGVKK